MSWFENLAKAVDQLLYEYVFLFLDALFFVGPSVCVICDDTCRGNRLLLQTAMLETAQRPAIPSQTRRVWDGVTQLPCSLLSGRSSGSLVAGVPVHVAADRSLQPHVQGQ